MTRAPVNAKRWTRVEYERLVDVGVLRPGDPIELIDGQLMMSEPQGSAHFTAVGLAEDALRAALGPGWVVRAQGPVALDDDSEPKPDVAHHWIVNLVDRVVEVCWDPVPDPAARFGWIYRSAAALGPGAHIAPLAAPEARIAISDLLP